MAGQKISTRKKERVVMTFIIIGSVFIVISAWVSVSDVKFESYNVIMNPGTH